MNGDLISRSALLDKLRFAEEHGNGFGLAFPIELVELAPAVAAGPDWISVTDKQPEDMLADKDTKVIHCLVALEPPRSQPKRKPLVTKAQRQWNSWTNHWEWGRVSGVTHWMPLPEPPKEV